MAESAGVLIVGAGPVGLVAALALARQNVPVRVVDAGSDIERRMRASTIHPPTLDMLAELGVAGRLVDAGLEVRTWQLRQHESARYVNFELRLIADRTDHPFRLQVEQHQLCDSIIPALSDLGVRIEFECAVASLHQDGDGVDVGFRGDRDPVRASWVIGADGASSTIRELLALRFAGKTDSQTSVLLATPFPFHRKLDNLQPITYCWSNRGPFTLLRMKEHWRVSLHLAADDEAGAMDEEHLRDLLAHIHTDAGEAELIDIQPYRAQERCLERFRDGRVCLAGDAAHLNPTSGGMGMNGGIHDAMNLAGKLHAVINGANDALLDRYSRQRQHAAAKLVIPRASATRSRMTAESQDRQMRRLTRYRAIAGDEKRCREFLLASSMITGLDEAAAIE